MKIEDLSGNYLLLSGENEDIEIEVIDLVEYRGITYVCALPVDELECDEIYILQENIIGDVAEYLSVNDEKILSVVFDEFMKQNKQYFEC